MLKSFRNDRSVAKFDAIFKLPNLRTIAIHLQQWDSKTLRSFTHKIRLRIFSMYPRNKSAVCTKNASRRRIHREFSANSRTIRLRLFPCIRTIRRGTLAAPFPFSHSHRIVCQTIVQSPSALLVDDDNGHRTSSARLCREYSGVRILTIRIVARSDC